jgi:hypothetical protein
MHEPPQQVEAVRLQFLPETTNVLFVGESRPAGGTFFYSADSKLYFATKEAFRLGVPDLSRGPIFLERFRALGCFLDDLCLEPVNHLKRNNPLAWAKRLRLREEGEEPLAERIHRYGPRQIVVVMKEIEPNVRRAALAADVGDIVLPALPFPSWKANHDRYVDELSALLKRMRGDGVLRRD